MPNPPELDEVHLVSPAQVAACRQLRRDHAALQRWAVKAAQQLDMRAAAGTATPVERRLWEAWKKQHSLCMG